MDSGSKGPECRDSRFRADDALTGSTPVLSASGLRGLTRAPPSVEGPFVRFAWATSGGGAESTKAMAESLIQTRQVVGLAPHPVVR